MNATYTIETRPTPGSTPTTVATAKTLREARRIASQYDSRRDLTYQDVAIRRGGKIVEYAGPAR